MRTRGLAIPKLSLSHFADEEALERVGGSINVAFGQIIEATIAENAHHVRDEDVLVRIVSALQTIRHRTEV